MTYRIEIRADALVFVGCLDPAALKDIKDRFELSQCKRVVLGAGTLISPECIPDLIQWEIPVSAESSFIARWLESARTPGGQS